MISFPARRLLIRTSVLLAPLAAAAGCGNRTTPSSAEAERLIRAHPAFATPRSALLSSRIVIRGGYDGSPLARYRIEPEAFGTLDWMVQALEGAGAVRIVDRPMLAPTSTEVYDHVIDVRPTPAALATGDFTAVEEEEAESGGFSSRYSKIPGWRVALARRAFVRTTRIVDHSETTESVPFGSAHVHFEFRWVPTNTGAIFDQGRNDFLSLQRPAFDAARKLGIDTRVPLAVTAEFKRDEGGRWRILRIDCGRKCLLFESPVAVN